VLNGALWLRGPGCGGVRTRQKFAVRVREATNKRLKSSQPQGGAQHCTSFATCASQSYFVRAFLLHIKYRTALTPARAVVLLVGRHRAYRPGALVVGRVKWNRRGQGYLVHTDKTSDLVHTPAFHTALCSVSAVAASLSDAPQFPGDATRYGGQALVSAGVPRGAVHVNVDLVRFAFSNHSQ
jgi:hypothetical protein